MVVVLPEGTCESWAQEWGSAAKCARVFHHPCTWVGTGHSTCGYPARKCSGELWVGASLRSTAWRPTLQMDLPELWREAWAELGAVAACLLSEAEYGCKEEGPHCSTAQHLYYCVRGRCWALTACPDLLTLLTHVPGSPCAPPGWSETAVSSLSSAFIPVLSLLL